MGGAMVHGVGGAWCWCMMLVHGVTHVHTAGIIIIIIMVLMT